MQQSSNTEAAVLNLFHNIYINLESRKTTAVLFIDLSKAFDSIDLAILILKLEKLKMNKKFLELIISFITNRWQCVEVQGSKSTFREMSAGVPQGSILGPLLFLFYINSITDLQLKGNLQLYADDIALVYGVDSLESLKTSMESDLKLLKQWLNCHKMLMNEKKTQYVLFKGKKSLEYFTEQSLSIKVSNKVIERVSSALYLGLWVDEKLSFKPHFEHLKKKILPFAYAVRRARSFIPS